MKKPLLLLISILVFSFSATTSFSQEKHGWPSVTLVGGGYSFDSSVDLDTEVLYGIKLGYEINGDSFRDRLGIEAVLNFASGTEKNSGTDIDASLLRFDILYMFDMQEKVKNIVPFLTIGGGGRFLDGDLKSDSSPLICYGAGIKFPLTAALALRSEARHILIFDDQQENDFEYTLGLQYTFGKVKKIKKEAKAQLDSDGDGIVDAQDQCPDTPEGLKVNRTGCPTNPPDSDADGVPDYLDKCPETKRGSQIDQQGCLIDSDKDGIPDDFDKCPNNPPGFEVDTDGCMKISN